MGKVGIIYRQWSKDDDELLLKLRSGDRLKWPQIGKRMQRTPGACKTRYSLITGLRARRPDFSDLSGRAIMSLAEIHAARLQTPAERRRERERQDRQAASTARAEAEWQARGCITSSYFGDPPPGWSALDRKRKAQHA